MAKSRRRLARRNIHSKKKFIDPLKLDGLFDVLVNESIRPKPADVLYHYTDWNGARGILLGQHFWETAHDCTNDEAELVSAHSVILEVAGTLRKEAHGVVAATLDLFLRSYPRLQVNKLKTIYLACFTLAKDDREQWGKYADNGRGLNTERIKAKAIQNGLVSEADLEKMTEAQIHKFIFAPGFSTAAAVTSVSGRGVGMDVVRTNIDQIGGTIDIKSVAGEGSSVTIKIPLTLAIVSALIVEAAGDRFAIPQLSVVELVRARANSEHRIERIKDTAVLRLRNKLLPLMHLKKLLKIDDGSSSDPENGFIVVTQVGSQTFGIVVDGVFHTEEIVVKPMSTKLRHIDMFSGNTILGDGAVIMIIDPNGIAKALGASGSASRDLADDNAAGHAITGEQLTSLLVFRAGSSQPKAVPLGLVTRLEEIATDKIELSNGRYMVQYREQLMPLVQMDGVTVQTTGSQPILVFADDGRSMGLVVDEIIDIVEERLHIEVAGSQSGILGSAVIKGLATEVIDVGHFLPMAFADWFSRKEMRPSMSSQSVLLVDDSAFFRNMLAPVLKAAGYKVRVAPNAQEGLTALRSGQVFDVVLTDIEMPDMNGFEFAETIRADQHLSSMPIIALSSMVSPAAIERGRQAGFHDYVAKFDRPGLIAALKEQTAAPEIRRAA